MKKITILLAGLLVSGYASAVTFTSTSGKLLDTDCTLLNESVTINLSKDVVGGASCNARAIALTTCHIGGRKTQRNAPKCTDTDGDADTGLLGKEDCSATETEQVTGAAVASATTLAGTVQQQYPGATCTAGLAEAQATENLPGE